MFPIKFSAALGFLLFTGSTLGQVLINGDFEIPTIPSNENFRTYLAGGEPSGFGWKIPFGSVDILSEPFTGKTQTLDISGAIGSTGAIEQSISFPTPGSFKFGFEMAGNPHGGPTVKSMLVSLADSNGNFQFSGVFQFDTSGQTLTTLAWANKETPVFALQNPGDYTLRVTDLGATGYGALIDNVMLIAVPETSGTTLVGAFALCSWYLLRKRTAGDRKV